MSKLEAKKSNYNVSLDFEEAIESARKFSNKVLGDNLNDSCNFMFTATKDSDNKYKIIFLEGVEVKVNSETFDEILKLVSKDDHDLVITEAVTRVLVTNSMIFVEEM